MKFIQTIVNMDNGRKARIYHEKEWNQYVVRFYQDGKHLSDADYYCEEKEDAQGTAMNYCFPVTPEHD